MASFEKIPKATSYAKTAPPIPPKWSQNGPQSDFKALQGDPSSHSFAQSGAKVAQNHSKVMPKQPQSDTKASPGVPKQRSDAEKWPKSEPQMP